MQLTKAEVTRYQLGTALELFMHDQDPVSVHVLACSGGEIADHLSHTAGQRAFSTHMIECNPDIKDRLKSIRNQYWNAFKHATTQGGKPRDDSEMLNAFSDEQNDHLLWIGWYDYSQAGNPTPIAAQVFQFWYFAKYPTKVNLRDNIKAAVDLFGDLTKVERTEAKRRLRVVVADFAEREDLRVHPLTDPRPLVIPRRTVPAL